MKRFTIYRHLIFVILLLSCFIAQAHRHNKNDTTVYVTAQEMPIFGGGPLVRNTYLATHLKYPEEAVKSHVSGTVYVTFVVEKDGSISNIKVSKGIGHGCDKEAMRVVAEMPKWGPGINKRKKAVRVRMTMPVVFNLQLSNKIYTHADQYPVFNCPGGLKLYLSSNKRYPVGIVRNKVVKTVHVFFVVNPDKSISQVTVKKDSGALNAYDYEAMRLVKSIKVARPAYVQQYPVHLKLYVPIVFDYKKVDTITTPKIDTLIDGKTFSYYLPNQVFVVVDHMPTFPGGDEALMRYLGEHVQFPAAAKANNQQGTVYLSFIVEGDGTITHIKVLRGVCPSINAEAVRVVKNMPKWKPGTQRGKPVRVAFHLPLRFTLQ